MPPQSRGSEEFPSFELPDSSTPDSEIPINPQLTSSPSLGSSTMEGDADDSLSLDSASSSSSSSSSSREEGDTTSSHAKRRVLHSSSSSLLMANAFAPPFYNRPPTPLPPSPSLTSLLRPSFSTTTSRPSTPDSSENDTPNETESAVAKSARIAATVPRASPKVPTYEYYGFVLYLMSSLAFGKCLHRCLPELHRLTSCAYSYIPPLVLSSVPLPPPTWHTLLSQSMVVTRYPFIPSHDHCLHLCGACVLQYRILDFTYGQH